MTTIRSTTNTHTTPTTSHRHQHPTDANTAPKGWQTLPKWHTALGGVGIHAADHQAEPPAKRAHFSASFGRGGLGFAVGRSPGA